MYKGHVYDGSILSAIHRRTVAHPSKASAMTTNEEQMPFPELDVPEIEHDFELPLSLNHPGLFVHIRGSFRKRTVEQSVMTRNRPVASFDMERRTSTKLLTFVRSGLHKGLLK